MPLNAEFPPVRQVRVRAWNLVANLLLRYRLTRPGADECFGTGTAVLQWEIGKVFWNLRGLDFCSSDFLNFLLLFSFSYWSERCAKSDPILSARKGRGVPLAHELRQTKRLMTPMLRFLPAAVDSVLWSASITYRKPAFN